MSSPPASEQQPPRGITLGRAAGLGALTSLSAVVVALIRSKASAVYLGPEGVGVAAELQQIAALATVPLGALVGPALLTALAKEQREDGPRRAIAAALGWLVVLGLLASAVAVGGLFYTLPATWSSGLRPLLALACLTLTLAAASNVGLGSLTFDQALTTTARLQITTGLLTALLVAGATAAAGLAGQFLAAALAGALSLALVLRAARRATRWPSPLQPRLDRGYLRHALQLGATSLVAALALQGALFALRARLEQTGGPSANGQFQAAWAVGAAYLGVVLAGMGSFVFPRYAKAKGAAELQVQLDEAGRFVLRLAPPVVFIAIGFADLGLRVMYSHRFDAALGVLKWQFAGDVAKCLAWVYAGPLLYRGKLRLYVVTEALASLGLGLGSWLLIPEQGLAGTGLAYFLSYVGYLALTAAVARARLEVQPRPRHLALAALATLLALGLSWAGHTLAARAAAVALALAWGWRSGLGPQLSALVRARRQRGAA